MSGFNSPTRGGVCAGCGSPVADGGMSGDYCTNTGRCRYSWGGLTETPAPRRRFLPGDEINVAYDGHTTRGRITALRAAGWLVYETLDDTRPEIGDRYAGMKCEAAEEFCYHDDEPRPDEPLVAALKALVGTP